MKRQLARLRKEELESHSESSHDSINWTCGFAISNHLHTKTWTLKNTIRTQNNNACTYEEEKNIIHISMKKLDNIALTYTVVPKDLPILFDNNINESEWYIIALMEFQYYTWNNGNWYKLIKYFFLNKCMNDTSISIFQRLDLSKIISPYFWCNII